MPDNILIKIGMDVTQVMKPLRGVGDEIEKNNAKLGGAAKATENWTASLGRTAAAVAILARGLSSVGAQQAALIAKSQEASKAAGSSSVNANVAGAKLGLSGNQVEALLSDTGARSREEVAGLLTALSKDKHRRPKPGDVFSLVSNFKTGLVSEDETLDAGKRGGAGKLSSTVNARQQSFSTRALVEVDTRRDLNARSNANDDALFNRGSYNRIAAAELEAVKRRSPRTAGVLDTAGGLLSPIGGDDVINAILLRAISNQLATANARAAATANTPTLAPPVQAP